MDENYLNLMIKKIKKYIAQGRMKDEKKLLIEEGFWNKDGSVVCDYPKLISGDKIIDLDGNLFLLRQELQKLRKQNKPARIEYFPKKYSYYLIAVEMIRRGEV